MVKPIFFTVFFILCSSYLFSQRFKLTNNVATQRVDVAIDGKDFTSYIYPSEDLLKKPVLFPIRTAKGTLITRGFPLLPRAGDRTDHPHHVGMWLNFENVNGFDYWNNSTAIDSAARRDKYGLIRHTAITEIKSGNKKGSLKVSAVWVSNDGKGESTIEETTTYIFSGEGNQRIIDRITTLKALRDVVFKDAKDGFFALRVARELEHPSTKPEIYFEANGVATKTPVLDNTNVTGNYKSSEGIEGEKVWSTRGKWMNLRGQIGTEKISIAIIDHPLNFGYPTYWHARGYGLFAANPLGAKIFSNGKEEKNVHLQKNETITFRYRTVITSQEMTDEKLNVLAKNFAAMR